NALLLAVGVHLALTLDAQARLQRARSVVNARMQHAAVVARLVLADARFLVEHSQPQAWKSAEQFAAHGQSENSGTDYHDVAAFCPTVRPKVCSACAKSSPNAWAAEESRSARTTSPS